jgi:hypothetical protein
MTLYQFWKDHECTPAERRELRLYLAFLRFKRILEFLA